MLRRSPPLSAIEAFLAATRAPSFKEAARALALSPSAFSRRIQVLERFVGAPLFDRSGPHPALTRKGARYRDEIGALFEAIGLATVKLRDESSSEELRVSASPSLVIDWLAPRLSNLRERLDLSVKLVVSAGTRALRTGEADVAIVGGRVAPAGFHCEPLLALEGMLVGAPTLCDGRPSPSSLSEIGGYDLLDLKTPREIWRSWFETLGRSASGQRYSPPFDSLHLMYESAAAGLGLALAVPMSSEGFLESGRLEPCAPERGAIGVNYDLIFLSPEAARRKAARRFKAWLFEEAAASMRLFNEKAQAHKSHRAA